MLEKLSSRIIAALNDRAAIRENNSVIPSLVFEETDQYSALRHSAIVMARFSTIS
ncbi:GSCOCG00011439001-RA-CDS [Cotesia congregata]|nr:GSCOCG00011439001-RA-CDS [Cotesia congregata]